MIEVGTKARAALGGSHTRHVRVQSWREGVLLAEDVPITGASEEGDRSLRVPERVTFTIPRTRRGYDWTPVTDDHPLAANGQQLRVQIGIGIGPDGIEWFPRGTFLIQDSQEDGNSVSVSAVGLLALIDEARFVSPYQPSGTLFSTLRGLLEPALTVVNSGLADRSVPSGINWDEDRLGAVLELLDAWSADGYVNEQGYFLARPDTAPTVAVLSLTNGAGGTVIRASGNTTREGGYNVVVARGTASDGAQVQGVAYDTSTGPRRYEGEFNPLPVPYFFPSPLLTTVQQAKDAAGTVLRRLRRSSGKQFDIEMVPDPTIQVGDAVAITNDHYTDLLCTVERLNLPYVADDGLQRLTVRSVS